MIRRVAVFTVLTAAVVGCVDAEKKSASDTAQIGVDSTSANAVRGSALNRVRPRPTLEKPDTSLTTEEIMHAPTVMRENTPSQRGVREDPLPNVIGETRKNGGRMKPLPPRDSAYGPKAGIDPNGKVVPIIKK